MEGVSIIIKMVRKKQVLPIVSNIFPKFSVLLYNDYKQQLQGTLGRKENGMVMFYNFKIIF